MHPNQSVEAVLQDDKYVEIQLGSVLPGDVVLYFDEDGALTHSGLVVEYNPEHFSPVICSKWGCGGEFVHYLGDCPKSYGRRPKFYRCCL